VRGDDVTTAIIACGALGPPIRQIVQRRGWDVEIHLMPSLLHNRPRSIAPRVEGLATQLQSSGRAVVLAYADCGTYGALDDVCERLRLGRLHGLHCYDVLAGADRVRELFEQEPGTYLLTDFLVKSFRRAVLKELGLDEHPELWDDYFAHYTRIVWLAQDHSEELETEALAIARMFSLPLTVREVGTGSLERELDALIKGAAPGHAPLDAAVSSS
jgi:hypothetical protein